MFSVCCWRCSFTGTDDEQFATSEPERIDAAASLATNKLLWVSRFTRRRRMLWRQDSLPGTNIIRVGCSSPPIFRQCADETQLFITANLHSPILLSTRCVQVLRNGTSTSSQTSAKILWPRRLGHLRRVEHHYSAALISVHSKIR